MLTVIGSKYPITKKWADALRPLIVRHPNRAIHLKLTLTDAPEPGLTFELDSNPSSDSDESITPFGLAVVRLTYFPGVDLAQKWLAAAWGCFLQHEALELVTVGTLKNRVLDPHETRDRLDHVFHVGFPFCLTPASLLAALATAIPLDDARAIVGAH